METLFETLRTSDSTTKKDEIVLNVVKTYNYEKFKKLKSNRFVSKPHLKRLKEAFQNQGYLITIILVNENFEIIDGQHRFTVCQELNLPLYYVVLPNYGLREVQIFNTNSKDWSVKDYLNSYVDENVKDYIIYKELTERYGFQHKINLILLTGRTDSRQQLENFRLGNLEITQKNKAFDYAEKIYRCGKYYEGNKRNSFILALYKCLENPKFDFDSFLHKLKIQRGKFYDCTDRRTYLELIDKIYNWRRAEDEKINLRD